jgi:hypothetical protein
MGNVFFRWTATMETVGVYSHRCESGRRMRPVIIDSQNELLADAIALALMETL